MTYQCVLLYSARANRGLVDRVRKIVVDCKYHPVDWAHTSGNGTIILREIWESIRNAHRVVAVLNEEHANGTRPGPINLNVLYETGYSHALKLQKTVLVCDGEGSLPFDLQGIRHVRWVEGHGDAEAKFAREIEESLRIQPEDRIARERRAVQSTLQALPEGPVRERIAVRFGKAAAGASALVKAGAREEDVEDAVAALEDVGAFLGEFVAVFARLRVLAGGDAFAKERRDGLAREAAGAVWRVLPKDPVQTPAGFRALTPILEEERDHLAVLARAMNATQGEGRRVRSLGLALAGALVAAALMVVVRHAFDFVREGFPAAAAAEGIVAPALAAETAPSPGAAVVTKELLFAFLIWLYVLAVVAWPQRRRWRPHPVLEAILVSLAATVAFAYLTPSVLDTSAVARVLRIFCVAFVAHLAVRRVFAAQPRSDLQGWRGAFRIAVPWALTVLLIDMVGFAVEDRVWTWFVDLGAYGLASLERLEVLVRHFVFAGIVLLAIGRGALGPAVASRVRTV